MVEALPDSRFGWRVAGGGHVDNERLASCGQPAAAVDGLVAAFAGEVAERLPRLIAALVHRDSAYLGESVRIALRDAHTLGGSAALLGEQEVSRSARRVEALLVRWRAEPVAGLLDDAAHEVDRLQHLLAGWARA